MNNMSRMLFDYDKLYNKPFKEQFLSQYKNEGSLKAMRRILFHAFHMEERLNKDLGAFTNKEIEYFIKSILKPSTILSAKTNCSGVALYLKFAKEHGIREDNFLEVNTNEYNKYATESETDLISFIDIDDITMTALRNANDALIIRLVFEGALGFELSEIANLKENDCVFETNTIQLHDDKKDKEQPYRELVVSKGTMELIRSAINEKTYQKKNGEMDGSNPRIKTEIELMESEYVLRPTANRTGIGQGDVKCSRATLYNRIRVVREMDALKSVKAKWTTKQIQRSGMLWQALKILQRNGKDYELTRNDYREIAERFGIAFNWQDRNVINKETIEKVYGKDYMTIEANNF